MSVASLNIQISPRRMLTEREAAGYCGLPAKHFQRICRVTPVAIPDGPKVYDMRDLDAWLDSIKLGAADTDDDVLQRLS